MSSEPTKDELGWLLGECETALSTIRKIIKACPSDIVAKAALPALESSLRHLQNDLNRWLEIIDERPISSEHFDRLCHFVRQSTLSVIHPQAHKIGLSITKPKRSNKQSQPSVSDLFYALALFTTQGFALSVLDRFQTSPPWAGNLWVPHLASLVTTYVLVLHHHPSWALTLCCFLAHGLCVRVNLLLGTARILGLFFLLASIVITAFMVGTRDSAN
ncbi:hypothetical protein F4777DRAFT_574376 [Nemania sp. FL0916]|nr:hypothetical protein F4777DRAFT_574376 [Nemania sp. FL0916]